MAKLKTVLDSLDGVEEAFHGFYQANDHGEFVLQLEDVDRHPTVRGLRTALDSAKTQRQEARAQLAHFQPILDAIGDDGDVDSTVHDLLGRMNGGGEGGEDIEARVAAKVKAVEAKFQRELDKATGRAGSMEKALYSRLVDSELDSYLERVGVKKELRPAVRALMKEKGPKVLELGEGDFKPVFPTDIHGVPEANQPLGDFITEWAKTDGAAHYLEPTGATGSGAPPKSGTGAPGGAKIYSQQQLQSGDFDLDAVAEGKATVVG